MKRIKLIISILATLILLGFIHSYQVYAASASLSAGNTSVNVGQSVTLTITIKGASWGVNLSGAVSGGYSDTTDDAEDDTKIYTTTFTPTEEGTYKINLSGTVTGAADSKATSVNDSVTITAKNPSSSSAVSSNANLKNLGITPNDFKGFKANTTTYNVTVPYDVEAVTVYAQAQDSKASVSGTGKKKLKEGSNSLQVVVTAEDGNKKTYTINVVRTSDAEEMTPNVIDENNEEANKPESLRLTAISLQNDLNLTLLPAFNSETFEYTVEVANDLEKLELSGIPNVNGAKVIIEGNDQLDSEENIITITVKADGYEDVIYKIKVIKKAEEKQEEQALELVDPVDLDNSRATMKIIIILAVATFIIIAIIIILILKRKKDKKRLYSSYYDYYNDYPEESEKVDLIKEMENKGSGEKETRKNIFEDDLNNSNEETPEGYTVEIEADTDVAEKPRRKRGKGKHF